MPQVPRCCIRKATASVRRPKVSWHRFGISSCSHGAAQRYSLLRTCVLVVRSHRAQVLSVLLFPFPRHCPHGSHCVSTRVPFAEKKASATILRPCLKWVPTPLSSFHRRQEGYVTHVATRHAPLGNETWSLLLPQDLLSFTSLSPSNPASPRPHGSRGCMRGNGGHEETASPGGISTFQVQQM